MLETKIRNNRTNNNGYNVMGTAGKEDLTLLQSVNEQGPKL